MGSIILLLFLFLLWLWLGLFIFRFFLLTFHHLSLLFLHVFHVFSIYRSVIFVLLILVFLFSLSLGLVILTINFSVTADVSVLALLVVGAFRAFATYTAVLRFTLRLIVPSITFYHYYWSVNKLLFKLKVNILVNSHLFFSCYFTREELKVLKHYVLNEGKWHVAHEAGCEAFVERHITFFDIHLFCHSKVIQVSLAVAVEGIINLQSSFECIKRVS
jgi:hypothetical protein